MRENLDIGRLDHVQLIFNRRRRTTSRFRIRIITDGVQPSLHVEHSRIKQYFKEGRAALRTEMVIKTPTTSVSSAD